MVSREKLFTKLDLLEIELEQRLVAHLEEAVLGKNDLVFCVTDFRPAHMSKLPTDKITEELVGLGAQILALKSKLGESAVGSIAERICWYCREWGDIENRHRTSAPGLAKQFLEEIEQVTRDT